MAKLEKWELFLSPCRVCWSSSHLHTGTPYFVPDEPGHKYCGSQAIRFICAEYRPYAQWDQAERTASKKNKETWRDWYAWDRKYRPSMPRTTTALGELISMIGGIAW